MRDASTSMLDPALAPIEDVQRRLAEYRRTGSQLGVTVLCAIVGEALAQRQRFDALRDIVVEGIATMERTSERFLEAELYRLKACALLGGGEPDTAKAQSYFDRALAVARQQQAKSWELRAAMSLARLWRLHHHHGFVETTSSIPKLAQVRTRLPTKRYEVG